MTMLLSKFKTVTMVLLIAALVGGTGLFYRIQAAPPANAAPGAAGSPTGEDEPDRDKNAEPGSSEQSGRSLLSSSPMPWQALVSLEKGKLVVRTSSVHYEPTTVVGEGGNYSTSYQKVEILRTMHYDSKVVKVYDVRGKRIDTKELPHLLKKETVALASTDPQAADPLNLRLFKEGTLLFVLPVPPVPRTLQAVPTNQFSYPPAYEPVPVVPPVRSAPPLAAPNKKS